MSARAVLLLGAGAVAPAGAWALRVEQTLGEGPAAALVAVARDEPAARLLAAASPPPGATTVWPGEAILATGPQPAPGTPPPAGRAALFACLSNPAADAAAFERWLRTEYLPALDAEPGIARAEVVRLAPGCPYHYANLVDLAEADVLTRGSRPQSPVAQDTSFGHIGPAA